VVRAALAKSKKAGLGKIAFGGREHILAITAAPTDGQNSESRGMMAYTMRYQEELRKPAEYFGDIKKVAIDKDSLELAETLIKKRTAKFDPSKFTDGYEAALKELVEAKIKHAPIPKDEVVEPKRGQVINLMDALRKSVQGSDATAATGKKKPPMSVKEAPAAKATKGIALVKPAAKATARRKSA
jgi:DNA end-binding protein Ku